MRFVRHFATVLLLCVCAIAQSGPPSLCRPCLFYGGDYDETDINSTAFPDENTGSYPETSTYGTVFVPAGHSILVEGILFQIQFDGTVKLDPNGVSWEIRTLLSEGNGGTLIASGQGPVVMQPTGRGGNGFEYTVAVKVKPATFLTGNSAYSFNITPPCLGKHDQACVTNQYAVSNTTHRANSYRGVLQGPHDIFINSKAFGWD